MPSLTTFVSLPAGKNRPFFTGIQFCWTILWRAFEHLAQPNSENKSAEILAAFTVALSVLFLRGTLGLIRELSCMHEKAGCARNFANRLAKVCASRGLKWFDWKRKRPGKYPKWVCVPCSRILAISWTRGDAAQRRQEMRRNLSRKVGVVVRQSHSELVVEMPAHLLCGGMRFLRVREESVLWVQHERSLPATTTPS